MTGSRLSDASLKTFLRYGICGHFKSESDRGRIHLYPTVPCNMYFIQSARWHCMQDEISFLMPRKVQPCATAVGSLRVRESMSMEVRLPINRLRPRPDMVWQQQRHRRIDEVFLSLPAHPLRRSICSITGCRQSGHDFLDI